jgi:hypothetical protein
LYCLPNSSMAAEVRRPLTQPAILFLNPFLFPNPSQPGWLDLMRNMLLPGDSSDAISFPAQTVSFFLPPVCLVLFRPALLFRQQFPLTSLPLFPPPPLSSARGMLSKPFRDPLRRCTRSLPSLPSLSFHPTVLTQDDPVLCYEAPSRPVGCFPSFRYCGLWFAFLLLSRPRVSVTIDASMSTLYFSGRQYVIRRLNPEQPRSLYSDAGLRGVNCHVPLHFPVWRRRFPIPKPVQ